MQIQPFSSLYPDAQPFVVLNVAVTGRGNIKCIGHDWYCCNDKCNCQLTNIMMHDASTGEFLTMLHYGWRDSSFYLGEKFDPRDVKGMVLGDVPELFPKDTLTKCIIAAFRAWLKQDKKAKVIFAERYQMFRKASVGMYSHDNEAEDVVNAFLLGALLGWDKK